jgi:hypothetical protein
MSNRMARRLLNGRRGQEFRVVFQILPPGVLWPHFVGWRTPVS